MIIEYPLNGMLGFFLVTPSELFDFKEVCTFFTVLTKLYYSPLSCRKGLVIQMTPIEMQMNFAPEI